MSRVVERGEGQRKTLIAAEDPVKLQPLASLYSYEKFIALYSVAAFHVAEQPGLTLKPVSRNMTAGGASSD